MENFKYVFENYGLSVTYISKQKDGILVETNEMSIWTEIIKELTLIKGTDEHVYKLAGISADNLNDNKEIHLNFWYDDLNKLKVNRI